MTPLEEFDKRLGEVFGDPDYHGIKCGWPIKPEEDPIPETQDQEDQQGHRQPIGPGLSQ